MSNPQPYEISYSFSGFQASNPATPLPANRVDAELANIRTAIAGLCSAVEDIRRSDGKLANRIVTADSLAPDVLARLVPENVSNAIFDALVETWFAQLPTSEADAASGAFWNNDGTLARKP